VTRIVGQPYLTHDEAAGWRVCGTCQGGTLSVPAMTEDHAAQILRLMQAATEAGKDVGRIEARRAVREALGL